MRMQWKENINNSNTLQASNAPNISCTESMAVQIVELSSEGYKIGKEMIEFWELV
jgi:hypothetical protein